MHKRQTESSLFHFVAPQADRIKHKTARCGAGLRAPRQAICISVAGFYLTFYWAAITEISTLTNLGRAATCTHSRAGAFSAKYLPYNFIYQSELVHIGKENAALYHMGKVHTGFFQNRGKVLHDLFRFIL